MWRGGRWNNTCFAGRCGWWWFAGGSWYFYERPIYPYPLIVSEGIFIEPAPPVIVAPALSHRRPAGTASGGSDADGSGAAVLVLLRQPPPAITPMSRIATAHSVRFR